MIKRFYLEATTQASYCKKAEVIEEGKTATLYSYNTPVCKIDVITKDFTKLWNGYSKTTQAHINDFRRLYDLEAINKKEWDLLSCSNCHKYKILLENGFTAYKPTTTFDNYTQAEEYADSFTANRFNWFYTIIEA